MSQEEDLMLWKIIAIVVIVVFDLIGTMLPLYYTSWFAHNSSNMSRITCLASGIMLGTALLQMLSSSEKQPSVDSDGPDFGFPIVHFLCALGFSVTVILQWVIENVRKRRSGEKEQLTHANPTEWVLMADPHVTQEEEESRAPGSNGNSAAVKST